MSWEGGHGEAVESMSYDQNEGMAGLFWFFPISSFDPSRPIAHGMVPPTFKEGPAPQSFLKTPSQMP